VTVPLELVAELPRHLYTYIAAVGWGSINSGTDARCDRDPPHVIVQRILWRQSGTVATNREVTPVRFIAIDSIGRLGGCQR
jgi:hypothetical protein